MVDHRLGRRHALEMSPRDQTPNDLLGLIAATVGLLSVSAWSYWPVIGSLFKEWQTNDDYSSGQLVPLIALFLVWRERKNLRECFLKPCWSGGIALLAVALMGRVFGLLFMYESAERYSLVLSIAGLVLMVAGWQVFRRVSWILLFLFLMVPLPGRVHNLISGPLQTVATTGSVFVLEAFIPVSQQGNVVMLNQSTPMAVAEACSGLRMLTAFVIVAAFVAYMVKRPRPQKVVLLLTSIPVAVMCNILRLGVTAVLFLVASAEVAQKFFHDFAGLTMMPVAVLLMFGELWLMDKLVVSEPKPQPTQARAHAVSVPQVCARRTATERRNA